MVRLSELQLKEVIIVDDGRRLGQIYDLEINPNTGKIEGIILLAREKKGSFFPGNRRKLSFRGNILCVSVPMSFSSGTSKDRYF